MNVGVFTVMLHLMVQLCCYHVQLQSMVKMTLTMNA